ncbi:symplekin-like isoform X3 [Panicum virgatum]|uniref:Symplekin n=1 Tax=Panicum virgatum TaxID=38727 RepID=A0A8T0WKH9_PANVG|nr:symplekin-like isoform X3 [Panicum virgatum]KAG2647815.1 hypothetical protein PVAP13_2KG241400 [Panicum virgatum]
MLAARNPSPSFHAHDRPPPPAHDIAERLSHLRDLRREPLPRRVARIADLHTDEASPVRKHVAEIIGVVGSKHMEYLPDIIPCLLHLLNDEAPPVVRQAIKTGTTLFAKLIQRLVIQGLFSTGGIDDALKSSWEWLLKFKSAVSLMAFQTTGNEGVRLLAVKFVEKTVLMYTPDPNIPSDPPSEATKDMGFNVAWLRGGHPLLNVGDLAMEASQNLGLLLEQLKSPKVKSLSTSMIIVFITSLSAIAQRRPSFYGRILPVLLSLDPASSIIKLRVPGAFHALKSAFSACLECTHSSAEPWRARLLEAQNIINQGGSIEDTANAGKNFGDTSNREESWPLMFPLELDPWELLQKHVLSDYANNEGHELTLCILNRLYREAEQDQDFLSSRTATSVYESFLLTVAESLRDMFPASDKSLGKLLCEIPYLPEGVLKLLEGLCSPESNEKQDKDIQSGDRVTQGLSAVWNLIMLRPLNRNRCLEIALQSSTHHLEEVRMKAIRLVANKLFPMASISKKIEDFAKEKLNSVLEVIPSGDSAATETATPEAHNDGVLENLSASVADAQTLMSLYFALCTKKHSLLRHVFAIYSSLPQAAKQAVHRQVPILIRTIGSSPDLLGIISDPPGDCQDLLMQVLQTLTDAAVPSKELTSSIKNIYSKTKDVEFLFAILSHLPKDEVLPVFPSIVNLPMDKFQAALSRILQGSSRNGPSLDPSEILIAIHVIDPDKEGIPLKKVMDACSACFEQRTIFTQQVLAKALNQLVEQIPLPLLFMRTVMQAIGVFPALVDFVMEIMSRLVSKQIWKYPKLWVGFLKCAILTKPQSYGVLLQLPAPQLENALSKNPTLKAPLVEHAEQPNVRSTLPRSTLVVLGLAEDQQQPAPAVSQAQSSQNQAAETSSSAADITTEVTQESSAAS